jgi:hypothetical protein
MKRTLLDITQKINRKFNTASLTPINLNDSTYWIWEATGWKFVDVLREIEYRTTQTRFDVKVNTQNIDNSDYIIEEGGTGIIIKFIKANFEYELDSEDFIEIKGDIEYYA